MQVGEKLQYLRNRLLKMTQKEFAREVKKHTKVIGLYQEIISRYETGREPIKEHHLEIIASFYSLQFGNEVTKIDFANLTINELVAKLEGKRIFPSTSKPEKKPGKRYLTINKYYIIIGLVIIVFVLAIGYFLLRETPSPIVEITNLSNFQKIRQNNIEVEGKLTGSVKGYCLWLFIEKQDSAMNTYFWPKSEIETYQKTNELDTYKWSREVYHYPGSKDSLLYGNEFSISLFVMPKNKSEIIYNWFDECKKIERYPPLNAIPNPIIEYRQRMVSGLKLIN